MKNTSDFTITPTDRKGNKVALKEAKKVKITCKNTNQNTTQIKVIADGKDAGAINFFYPKPKTINLKWYFVELTGEEEDKGDLENLIDKIKLENLLKKGLNPALIDVTLSNTTAEIIDITEYRERLKNSKLLNTYKKTDGSIMKYIERGVNGRKANRVFSTFNLVHTKNDKIINLFCVNRKCINTVDIVDSGEYPMAGGLSPVNTGIAYMVLDDNEKMLPKHIIHEILHSFGLEHTFSTKAVHTFKDKKTKNYMDYSDTKFLTWKWQWEKLQQYLHLK
ncbi:MAG: hypothetical protein L3J23_01785 [Flavobacteriaceae bacterium]|nr:hypothetical protein [Flavobacteriaceae bacterium]